jgi:hypothetical protein
MEYDPYNWYWFVGGDLTQAWSSKDSAWVSPTTVDNAQTTRINSLVELSDVLRVYGLQTPQPAATDVRLEASRRMQELVGARDAEHLQIIIANGTREAVRLSDKRIAYILDNNQPSLTPTEEARATQLKALDAAIEAIRAASNAMEENPPLNYKDNSNWPEV